MEVAQIRDGLAEVLRDLDANIRVYAAFPNQVSVPCVIVSPESITYGQTYEGQPDITLQLHVLTGAATVRGQEQLDGYISTNGSQSISKAVQADETLRGSCASAFVTEMVRGSYAMLDIGDQGTKYYQAILTLDVYAR